MSCRLPCLVLAVVLFAPVSAMAQEAARTTVTTSELKSDSLAMSAAAPKPNVVLRSAPTLLASSLLGKTLYSRDGKEIGQISDIVLSRELDGLLAVVGIGGLVGMGTRDVAIPKDRIEISESETGKLRFVVASTKEQLQQAPVFDRTTLMR